MGAAQLLCEAALNAQIHRHHDEGFLRLALTTVIKQTTSGYCTLPCHGGCYVLFYRNSYFKFRNVKPIPIPILQDVRFNSDALRPLLKRFKDTAV